MPVNWTWWKHGGAPEGQSLREPQLGHITLDDLEQVMFISKKQYSLSWGYFTEAQKMCWTNQKPTSSIWPLKKLLWARMLPSALYKLGEGVLLIRRGLIGTPLWEPRSTPTHTLIRFRRYVKSKLRTNWKWGMEGKVGERTLVPKFRTFGVFFWPKFPIHHPPYGLYQCALFMVTIICRKMHRDGGICQ